MFAKLLRILVVLIFSAMTASLVVSVSPFLFPSLAETFFCPSETSLTIHHYSALLPHETGTGIYITCMDALGTENSYPAEFLKGFVELMGILTAIILLPAFLLNHFFISQNRISPAR